MTDDIETNLGEIGFIVKREVIYSVIGTLQDFQSFIGKNEDHHSAGVFTTVDYSYDTKEYQLEFVFLDTRGTEYAKLFQQFYGLCISALADSVLKDFPKPVHVGFSKYTDNNTNDIDIKAQCHSMSRRGQVAILSGSGYNRRVEFYNVGLQVS